MILQWLAPVLGGSRSKSTALAAKLPAEKPREPSSTEVEQPRRAPAGNAEFDRVYSEHFDFVWRNLYRLGVSQGDVDDAAHDVFLVVHKKLSEFDGRASIRTWLFAIAQRVAWHYRRSRARRRTEPLADEEPADKNSIDNEGLQSKREAITLVHRILEQLDDDRRAVFVLAELEQLSVPDIAEMLHLPLNTAYSRLRLARRDFEQKLRQIEGAARRSLP